MINAVPEFPCTLLEFHGIRHHALISTEEQLSNLMLNLDNLCFECIFMKQEIDAFPCSRVYCFRRCRDRLKQAVLAQEELESAREQSESRLWRRNSSRASTSNGDADEPPEPVSGLKVNLDSKLVEMLRDVYHLQRPPHDVSVTSRDFLAYIFVLSLSPQDSLYINSNSME